MTRSRTILVGILSSLATAVVLATGAHSAPSALEMKALKALAAARPAAAAVAAVPSAEPIEHRAPVLGSTQPATTSSGGGGGFADTSSSAPATTASSDDPDPTATPTATTTPSAPKATPSRAHHVVVVALRGTGYQTAFGPGSPATYLTKTLRPRGAVLSGFAPLGKADLPNYLAFAGGQPPNADTRAECSTYADFPASAAPDKKGVVAGKGCIYPNTVLSLGDQVSASGGTWRAYAQGMAEGEDGAATCRHPDNGTADPTLDATEGYVTRHNPFVYFHSLLDLGDCIAAVKDLGELTKEYRSPKTAPNFAFIAPDVCHDGTAETCADAPAGLAVADGFLKEWAPKVLESKAFKRDGVLIVAFLSGAGEPTGALVVSRFAKKASVYAAPFDPYSLLRSVEDLLELQPLAKAAGATSFAKLVLPAAFRR